MRVKFACLLVVNLLLTAPAFGQGMMENTSVQGTAAGLGGGLGASAYKLFNSNTSKTNASNSVNEAQKRQGLNSTTGMSAAVLTAKTDALTSSARQKEDAGDFSGAAKLWQELAQFRQKNVGKEDPVAGDAFKKAGSALFSVKQYSQAEDCLKISLGYSERINGANSPKSFSTLVELANSLKEQDRVGEAVLVYKRAMTMQEQRKVGSKNSNFKADDLVLLKNYESALQKNNNAEEALAVAKKINALETSDAKTAP